MFRCPYHDDHDPSFGVDTKKGAFNCFACRVTGTIAGLFAHLGIESDLEEVDAMSEGEWSDVLESLEDRATKKMEWPGVDLTIRSPFREKAPEKYANYLKGRDISVPTTLRFGIGWSSSEPTRILIPVNNLMGDQVNWVERRELGKRKPKYWRPKGVKKELALFGLDKIGDGHNWVIVTEGIFDAIALANYSLPAVCCFGGFSTFQRNALVKRFDLIYICFDGDKAGRIKSREARNMLRDCGVMVKNVKLPKGKDPGNYASEIARKMGSDWSEK
jgi:DNA primase